jgi:hypothetical protein
MKTKSEILTTVIENRLIGEQHSIMIHDVKSGKNIRYPVTTKSDADYVADFLRAVLLNTHEQLSALTAPVSAVQSAESTEVPPSVTGPADLNNPELEVASSEDDSDDDVSNVEQTG